MGKDSQGRRSSNAGSRGTPVAEHTAPMSGLKDVCFARGGVFKEAATKLWRRARKIHRPGMEKAWHSLSVGEYPEFVPPEEPNKGDFTSSLQFHKRYGEYCIEYEQYEESIDTWEGNRVFMYELVLQTANRSC